MDGSSDHDGARLPEPTDFLDPSLYEHGLPHAAYRRLRDHEPVAERRASDGPYWLLTRHADVFNALIDAQTYSSEERSVSLREMSLEMTTLARHMLINMDPPRHTRYRRIITRSFATRAMERIEPRVRQVTARLIDAVAARGECDLVTDFAAILPIEVMLDLLGVPRDDHAHLGRLSNRMLYEDDPRMSAGRDDALAANTELYFYCAELARRKAAEPGEDLTTLLLAAEVDGERLTPEELGAFLVLLVIAGHETTRALLPASLLALAEHPDELARLRADRGLLSSAVEETLRWGSPVLQTRRTTTRPVELHGRVIPAGARVILPLASANFDERAFAEPERFDVGRAPNPHVAFGVGPHLCLGAALARLEARVAIEAFLERTVRFEPAAPATRVRSFQVYSVYRAPIRFTATPSA